MRERKEDIVPLACFFLAQFNDRYNKQILSFSRQAESILKSYDWKGNVRELRNIVEKLVIFTEEKQIGIRERMQIVGMNGAVAKLKNKEELSLREAQSDFEREFILQTLNRFNWHINETANALGIHRTNLFKKMRFYNLKRK